jgi:hypothetical protein
VDDLPAARSRPCCGSGRHLVIGLDEEPTEAARRLVARRSAGSITALQPRRLTMVRRRDQPSPTL